MCIYIFIHIYIYSYIYIYSLSSLSGLVVRASSPRVLSPPEFSETGVCFQGAVD